MKPANGEQSDIVNPVNNTEIEIRPIDDTKENKCNTGFMKKYITIVYVILIVLGVGTGFILSGRQKTSTNKQSATTINTNKVVGSTDTTTFKDMAEGVIQTGGLDGEGTHQLVRDGGPSQTVYLISSIVDLDQFVGKKVKIWGQTVAAKKAAWLMDVGKVELE